MPTLTFDEKSLIADGRRLWLAAGHIPYCRLPRGLWQQRIADAKNAGLNCITTDVAWSAHEPAAGTFTFEGDADLRHFVTLIAEADMHCILKVGPYIGGDYDFGGLPVWLHRDAGHRKQPMRFRQPNAPFLEAVARYFSQLMKQVGDLQATAPAPGSGPGSGPGNGRGTGPIVMMQAESDWNCYDPDQTTKYLAEIVRYLRENNCEVPILNSNNLWSRVEGTIDTWQGRSHLAADLRQLGLIQPSVPRFLTGYEPGDSSEADRYNLTQVLAAGGQYEIDPSHKTDTFCDAFRALSPVNHFATQFAHVLAHLSTHQPHVAAAPMGDAGSPCIIHHRGVQGQVVYILSAPTDQTIDLLLPDGLTLPVPLGNSRVAWLLLNANLGGEAELTYTNLRPWAFVDKQMLVLFGPAGVEGLVSIDDAPLSIKVPTDASPAVVTHEDFTIVVVNDQQIAEAVLRGRELHVANTIVTCDGQTRSERTASPRKPVAPKLTAWQYAPAQPGEFTPIEKPAALEAFGDDHYGWYRTTIKQRAGNKLVAPACGQRLHLFADDKPIAHWDRWSTPQTLKAKGDITILAAGDGRASGGWHFGEKHGIFDEIYPATVLRLTKPQIVSTISPDIFALGGCFADCRAGDRHPADEMQWTIDARGAAAIIFDIDAFPSAAVIKLNDEPIGAYHPIHTDGHARFTFHVGDMAKRGKNTLSLCLFEPHDARKHKTTALTCYKATKPVSKNWAFAPLTLPSEDAFGKSPAATSKAPAWFATTFKAKHTDAPLVLNLKGMSQGLIHLNGHPLGRFDAAAQPCVYLPEPLLNTDGDNSLLLLDESGNPPRSCKLTYHS